jgi:hypothetical protein
VSFEIELQDGILILSYPDKGIILAQILNNPTDEYYILKNNFEPFKMYNSEFSEPYHDIEQALDDFEYLTEKIPTAIINQFKNKVRISRKETRVMENTKLSDTSDFSFEQEGSFSSLIHTPTGYQLNFSPESETISGEDEFSITTTDFEPIPNYEVLSKTFTTDFTEALQEFESLVGKIPDTITSEFVDKAFNIESSSVDTTELVVIDEDGKVLSYIDNNGYVDFIDTVDDEDGGYERAVKFQSPKEVKDSLQIIFGSHIPDNIEVVRAEDAFAFVNTSEKNPLIEVFSDDTAIYYPTDEYANFDIMYDAQGDEYHLHYLNEETEDEDNIIYGSHSHQIEQMLSFIKTFYPDVDEDEFYNAIIDLKDTFKV